jgi:hypothetical protein
VSSRGPAAIGSVPQSARRYDYWLGGKDNFAADRRSGDELKGVFPAIELAAQENRRFLGRVVHHLATDRGITQFLDIGAGMPAAPNVHDIAQEAHPPARVVYVDHDPVVAVHARALLTGIGPGVRVFVPGDLRRPDAIMDDPVLRTTLRLERPVGLLLFAVLHFVIEDDAAYAAVHRLVAALPPGSYVALSHVTFDHMPAAIAARLTALSAPGAGHGPFRARTRAEVAGFVEGLELIEPGLVSIADWHSAREPAAQVNPAEAAAYGVVARIG